MHGLGRIAFVGLALLLAMINLALAEKDVDPEQALQAGIAAYDQGDYQRAKELLVPLAESGHGKAMNFIGLMYSKGFGYSKNRKLACDWYEKSAEGGYASAQYNLSTCYLTGYGRRKNEKSSLMWSEKAAMQGDKDAMLRSMFIYHDNNDERYIDWGIKAANLGSVPANIFMMASGKGQAIPGVTISDVVCFIWKVGIMEETNDACD